jgi:hypothetical protein
METTSVGFYAESRNRSSTIVAQVYNAIGPGNAGNPGGAGNDVRFRITR